MTKGFTAYLIVLNIACASLPVLWWGTKSGLLTLLWIAAVVVIQYYLRRFIDPDKGAPDASAPTPRRFLWMARWFGVFVLHYYLFSWTLAEQLPLRTNK